MTPRQDSLSEVIICPGLKDSGWRANSFATEAMILRVVRKSIRFGRSNPPTTPELTRDLNPPVSGTHSEFAGAYSGS